MSVKDLKTCKVNTAATTQDFDARKGYRYDEKKAIILVASDSENINSIDPYKQEVLKAEISMKRINPST
jgi:hypothetical protein